MKLLLSGRELYGKEVAQTLPPPLHGVPTSNMRKEDPGVSRSKLEQGENEQAVQRLEVRDVGPQDDVELALRVGAPEVGPPKQGLCGVPARLQPVLRVPFQVEPCQGDHVGGVAQRHLRPQTRGKHPDEATPAPKLKHAGPSQSVRHVSPLQEAGEDLSGAPHLESQASLRLLSDAQANRRNAGNTLVHEAAGGFQLHQGRLEG
mmetsp:Transcript_27934/g.83519  ORF Transcript_27934/g.83519 Transcript_27934/m.83519 type:complete len:204 (-) Transcript_27934:29-640(-)